MSIEQTCSKQQAGEASADINTHTPPAHIPSSCTPGTVLTGLAILKDAPEVIAKPDEEYPSWLWELANEPAMKTTFASTDAAEVIASESGSSSAFPATKGALRAKEKRAMKAKRAAQAAEDRAQAKAARIAKAAKGAEVPKAQQKAAEGRDPIEVERETQRALRKANRDRIRTNNFIQSS